LNPQSQITVLFHDLYLIGSDGEGETLVKQAVSQGITFFRYSKEFPPIISEDTIDLPDPLTNDTLRIPYQRAILAMPLVPQEHANQLARLLHLPLDKNGYMIRPRIRLRPGRFTDDGIFIVGGSHQPSTLEETLLQAYLTSGRTQHFLHQETIRSEAPAAQIDNQLCTGCGECVQACLTYAIHLEKQAGVLSRSQVDPLRCTGCGSCAVACPVKAISIPGWEDTTILAQISAALRPRHPEVFTPGIVQPEQRVLVLACEWSAYAAADIAGVTKKTYPANVRIIRMNCSARFDPYHVLWAFLNGAQGVFLGACQTGECHYGAGNLQAKERFHSLQHQLAEHRIDPERLHLEFLAADDGEGFVKALHNFIEGLGNQHRRTLWSKD
jgi:heterodisulfide reductase subunit A